MAKNTEARVRANAKYNATHVKMVNLHLNIGTDADIIKWLDGMENKTGYIKELIRDDMKKAPGN